MDRKMRPLSTKQVLALTPGREADILVTEYLLNQDRLMCRVDPVNHGGEPQFHWGQSGHGFAPDWSTDEATAFRLFKEGLMKFGTAEIFADMEDYGRGAILGSGPAEVMTVTIGNHRYTARFPEATCKAFLLNFCEDD